MSWQKLISLFLLTWLCLGFRLLPYAGHWSINKEDTKLFIKVCGNENPSIEANDLIKGDPLFGQTDLRFDDILTSVRNDFNNIPGSFLHLADLDDDSDYDAELHRERIIEFCFENQPFAGGHARPELNDNAKWIFCKIKINPQEIKKASNAVAVVTHELGHCAGLDHPQETRHAIMSYYTGTKDSRLQTDDKMGLIYLYPSEDDFGKESPTLGFSCNPKN